MRRSRIFQIIGCASTLLGGGAANAFTAAGLSNPNTWQTTSAIYQPDVDQPKVQSVWWCRWGCGPGWGYRPWGWGGFAAGAVVGGAVVGAAAAAPYYYGGPCWQRWVGPYGGVHWRRVC